MKVPHVTLSVLGGRKRRCQRSNMIGHGLDSPATVDFHASACVCEQEKERGREESHWRLCGRLECTAMGLKFSSKLSWPVISYPEQPDLQLSPTNQTGLTGESHWEDRQSKRKSRGEFTLFYKEGRIILTQN